MCSCICRLKLGRLPRRTLTGNQRILIPGLVTTWIRYVITWVFVLIFYCFEMSAHLGQGAFDQKSTGLGCNTGCFAFCGWYYFQGGSAQAPVRTETQLHRDFQRTFINTIESDSTRPHWWPIIPLRVDVPHDLLAQAFCCQKGRGRGSSQTQRT